MAKQVKSAPKCFMCKERKAKRIDGCYRDTRGVLQTYVNATKKPLFCSIRCAANYGLLWFDWDGFEAEIKDVGHTKRGS